jgi:hypothetical protein
MEEKIAVICRVDDLTTPGYAIRRDLTTAERLQRGGKTLGVCWLVAFVCIFVPILHFILVPLFFLLGLFLGGSVWMSKSEILEGEITCPNCKKVNQLPKDAESWPMQRRCEGCSFSLTIERENSPSV